MEFKKKLKVRAILALSYTVLGLGLIAVSFFAANEMASSFGLIMLVIGIARLVQLRRISRSQESIKQREIVERDERSVMLYTSARSLAFVAYIILAALAVIVLFLLGYELIGRVVSICFFSLILLYWICYFILSRKY